MGTEMLNGSYERTKTENLEIIKTYCPNKLK
jgi:hypothetical protein